MRSAPARDVVLAWLGVLARSVLGGVFVWAGLSKVGDLAGSVRAVNAYQVLPYELSTVFGSVLPFVEIVLGGLLLAGLATRLVAGASALLLAMFTAGIAAVWARGLSIDCGCFGGGGALGAGESPRYVGEIARDLGLLAAALLLVVWPATPLSLDRWLARADVDDGSHPDLDTDRDANIDGDTDPDANIDSDSDTDADTNTDPCADTDTVVKREGLT